ncbi:MAG TPA: electron transfer flavoprotein subunit beta/FixA family protein [Candidatus Kapabacteria bacterium]|nr:electron transfer flavoprotein subunit beta/FixA family protein [Candidatus Kapabacteria bacterium]
MNILVCVSHVPDTTTRVLVGPDGTSMDPTGVKFILNPYDEFAVEEALRLRDKHKGEVTVISVGPAAVKDAIRQALAMGADKGILVIGEKNDSFQVVRMLAAAISPLLSPRLRGESGGADLILLGKQSIDFDGMDIAPMLSEMLGLPAATVVVSLAMEGSTATVEKEIEGGREVIELTMPCIVATQKGLNDPRYPSLPNIMKAKQKPIQEILGAPGTARTEVVQMTKPEKARAHKILKSDGDAGGSARELARLLHEEAKVI